MPREQLYCQSVCPQSGRTCQESALSNAFDVPNRLFMLFETKKRLAIPPNDCGPAAGISFISGEEN